MSHKPMTTGIEGDELVIRVPIRAMGSILCCATGARSWLQCYRITCHTAFASDIVKEMANEEEDGTTPVQEFLERCAAEAIERGAEGVIDLGDPGDDGCAA